MKTYVKLFYVNTITFQEYLLPFFVEDFEFYLEV